MTHPLTDLPATRIAASVAAGELRAVDVLRAHLDRISARNPGLNALVHLDAAGAEARAREIDAAVGRGESVGPLAGVPFAVKDNIDVAGQVTACASRAHAGRPAARDAVAVGRLRAAGAVLVGRANMDELAMGASTQTSAHGPTHNPWDARRSPGGSSGGSAAAVAAGLVTFSIGTDTGGSIREPASQCGVVGLAPSPNLVPTDGVVPFSPAHDRVGPLTRTVADAALVLGVLAAGDVRPPGVSEPVRVGLVRELSERGNQPGVRNRLHEVLSQLGSLDGIEPVEVSLADAAAGLAAYLALTSAACVPTLGAYLRTGRAGAEVTRRWYHGLDLLQEQDELRAARAVQRRLAAQVRVALSRCDVLVSPTMPTTAPVIFAGHAVSERDLADPLHTPYTDCWAVLANLLGLAAVSVPAGRSPTDGMPVGVQLAGPPGSDPQLLALAARLGVTADGPAGATG